MLTWGQKKAVIFLCSIIGTVSDKKCWSGFFLQKSFFEKAEEMVRIGKQMEDMLKLPDKDYEEMVRDYHRGIFTVDVVHETEAAEKFRQVRKLPIKIQKEYLDDLVGIACENCRGCKRNVKHCNQRKLFRKIGIVALDPERTESKCEYWYIINVTGVNQTEVLANG